MPTLGQNNGYSERRTDWYQQLLAHILLALAFLGSRLPQRLDTHIEGCFALSIPSRLLVNACYCFTIRHGIILDSIFFTRQYHFLLWVIDWGKGGENILSTALHGKRVSERRTKACVHNYAVEEQSSRRVSLCEHCIDRSLHFGRAFPCNVLIVLHLEPGGEEGFILTEKRKREGRRKSNTCYCLIAH